MKFSTVASLGLFASFGTSRCAESATFDNLLALVAELQEEAAMLATEFGQKDEEIASLISQLGICEGGGTDEEGSTGTVDTTTTTSTGDFQFSGRQSWNYNLGSPVDTNVDVDVFFIDMGEVLFCFVILL